MLFLFFFSRDICWFYPNIYYRTFSYQLPKWSIGSSTPPEFCSPLLDPVSAVTAGSVSFDGSKETDCSDVLTTLSAVVSVGYLALRIGAKQNVFAGFIFRAVRRDPLVGEFNFQKTPPCNCRFSYPSLRLFQSHSIPLRFQDRRSRSGWRNCGRLRS